MAHQQPLKPSIFQYRVPRPADQAALRAYLDLGWVEHGEALLWSHARGSPVHPGDAEEPAAAPLLQQLPTAILIEARDRLPAIGECADRCLEVPVMVLIRYGRYSESAEGVKRSFWMAEDAKVIALAAESPTSGRK